VVAARTLFGAEDFRTVMRVLNLTDRPYELKLDQFLGTASQVEVFDFESPFGGGNGPSSYMAARRVEELDVGHVQCLIDELPTDLNETADSKPVQQALRRHPVVYFPLIDKYVQQMQDNGIVEPRIGSEWVSNIVLVKKKDGALRYCIDYRGLNAITTKGREWSKFIRGCPTSGRVGCWTCATYRCVPRLAWMESVLFLPGHA